MGTAPSTVAESTSRFSKRLWPLAAAMAVLAAIFHEPLQELIHTALDESLYSHILLIPFVSLYLVYTDRPRLEKLPSPAFRFRPLAIVAVGLALTGLWFAGHMAGQWTEIDYLSLTAISFVVGIAGVCGLFLSAEMMRAISFPLLFLIFITPFPSAMREGIETFMQYSSAMTAEMFLKMTGMPTIRHGIDFQLPGFSMQVAPECSGIHSSYVLFITSLMAGHLFLRTPWKRAVLAVVVLPLAILRNGFRVFVIGQLCVRIGPHMIDSPIHHQGGPLFFALSLIPLFALLYFLHQSDRIARRAPVPSPGG